MCRRIPLPEEIIAREGMIDQILCKRQLGKPGTSSSNDDDLREILSDIR